MAIIKRFKCKGFIKLTDFEMGFSTGLNVIKSPNEAGKSSLLAALLEAFYGDATSRSQELLSRRSWNSGDGDEFFIKVELADFQGLYTVMRDFQQKGNCIKLPDGKTFKDKKIIQEKLGDLLGFPSLKGYLSTACIMQEELRQVKGTSLLSLIEERLLQGTQLQKIQDQLVKDNRELEKRGGKDPGPIKRLEEKVRSLNQRQKELYEEVKRSTGGREELESLSDRVKKLEEKKEGKNTELQKIAGYIAAKERFDKSSEKWDEADKEMRRREKVEKELDKSKKELEEIKREIGLCEKKIYQAEQQLLINRLKNITEEKGVIERQLASPINEEHFRSAEGIPGEINSLKSSFQNQKGTVKQTINRVREAKKRIDDNTKLHQDKGSKLGNLKKRLEYLRLYKNREEILEKIDNLKTITPEMEVTIRPQKSLPLRIEADSKITHDGEVSAVMKEKAKRQLEISIKDVIGIGVVQKGVEVEKLLGELEKLQSDIKSIDYEIRELTEYATTPDKFKVLEEEKAVLEKEVKQLETNIDTDKGSVEEGGKNIISGRKGWDEIFGEIQRKKSEQQKIFSRYKVQNLQELRTLKKSYEDLQNKKREKDIEYKNLLNNRTFEQIEKELTELTNELRKEGQQPILPEELNETKEKKKTLEGKASDLEKAVSEKKGVLKTPKDTKTLEEEKKASAKEMGITEEKIERLGFSKEALKNSKLYSEYMTQKLVLEGELKKFDGELSTLNKDKHHLEGYLKAHQKGAEDIAELEEEIFTKEEELKRHERQLKINKLLIDCFSEARSRTMEAIPQTLAQKIEQHLSFITSNRYSKVDIKIGQELNLLVWSDEKRDWIDINESPTEPSTGLLDQLYFATRLALIEVLAQEQHPPILMDDPFVHFDDDRTEKAIELLEKFSQHFQILIFTCHDYPQFEKYRLNQELSNIKVFTT